MNNRIVALGLLLLSVALFLSYVNPTWTGKIAETKAAIESNDQALLAAQQYVARQQQLVADRNAINAEALAKLTVMLPDSVDNVGLVLSLNALAARSGLSISSIDVSNNAANTASAAGSDTTSPVGTVDLTLSATGNYAAFQNFLAGVERSQRLLDVRDLKITGGNAGSYTYQMILRIYWLR